MSPSIENEPELVARARNGDEESLALLLRAHGPEVRRSLAGLVPKRWQALLSEEDVLQQTFTDAFLEIGRFVPLGDGAFVAWLKRMARNSLHDALRMLEAQRAPIIVVRTGDESFRRNYPLLAEFIDERYQVGGTSSLGDDEVASDGYTVLVRRDRPSKSIDATTGLPCGW